jgi:hypothetical protein
LARRILLQSQRAHRRPLPTLAYPPIIPSRNPSLSDLAATAVTGRELVKKPFEGYL